MNKQDLSEKLENKLFEFVERVVDNPKTTSDSENQALPEVANVLAMLISKKIK